jgi:glycosyltransferase involved in cell wall biosynthesis
MPAHSSPKVSVIISFLNAQKFLGEAIESVFAQTLESWELLLVNDGSTDASSGLALQYVTQHPKRLRYFEHEAHGNLGLPASRNVGLRDAKGEYVALLDADDVWLPHKLEEQSHLLDSHPEAAMVYGSSKYWYSWTGKPGDCAKDFLQSPNVPLNIIHDPPSLLRRLLLGSAASPCPSDLLFRRDAVLRLGGFEESFSHNFNMYEDQAFLAKVCLHAKVFVAENYWDQYRLHPDSCCATTEREGRQSSVELFYLNWLERYLREQRVTDTEIWKAFRDRTWRHAHPRLAWIRDRARRLR